MLVPHPCPYPPPPRPAAGEAVGPAAKPPAGRWIGLAAALTGVSVFVLAPVVAATGAVACLFATGLPLVVRAGGFIVLTTLAVVYLKSLLPRRIRGPGAAVPVEPGGQPTAIAFLDRVAADVGAPAARRLVLGSGVELRLGGRGSLADLVRGKAPELHIGLWLWHGLTLSEFQALAARTLAPAAGGRLDRLRSAARALLDAHVRGTDCLDAAADDPTPLAALARGVQAVHRALTFPFRVLGDLLLRVEGSDADVFRDDLAAVRVAGSDALVHAILRADLAGAALGEAHEALGSAAADGVFTRDLLAHFADGVTLVREDHNDFTLGMPPTLRGPHAGKYVDVFEPGRRYLSAVWGGMPLGEAREQNAKRHFVAAERDDRPAVELLGDMNPLRERLAREYYLQILGGGADYVPVPPETVRRWLASRGGPALPARCAGVYDGGRRIELGTPAEREALLAEPWDDDRLLDTATGLYARAGERAATWRKARAALDQLLVRTAYEPAGRMRALADDLEEDVRKAGRWLGALDRWVYVVHVHMAARLGDLAVHDELIRRYESVLRFQPLAADAREYRNRVAAFIRRLAACPSPPPYRVARDAAREFKDSANDLAALLAEARGIDDPLLKEWTGDGLLDEFLYAHKRRPVRGELDLEDYGRQLQVAWEEVAQKARWLHRSGLAELLNLQQTILTEFSVLVRGTPPVTAGESPPAIELEPIDPAADAPPS